MMRFWEGKRVLITGHTGFKGCWLSELLLLRGSKVYGLALNPEMTPALFFQLGLKNRVDHYICDIRDAKGVAERIRTVQPDILIHMAAQSLVRRSYSQPISTFSTNTLGTVHVLDALREIKRRCAVIVVTTDKVYRKVNNEKPNRETDQLGGHDPYSASKAAAELVTECYRKSFFANTFQKSGNQVLVATVRAGNVMGGGDWAENRIVPDLARAFSTNRVLKLRNPTAIRPWQHVLDPLNGYLILAQAMYKSDNINYQQGFNFGPDPHSQCSVGELVNRVLNYWPGKVAEEIEKNKPFETNRLSINIDLARQELGWKPRWSLDRALTETVNWYRTVLLEGGDCLSITQSQILRFEADL